MPFAAPPVSSLFDSKKSKTYYKEFSKEELLQTVIALEKDKEYLRQEYNKQVIEWHDAKTDLPKRYPGSLIKEGSTQFCDKCGSSIKTKWWSLKSIGCIQSKCKNWYKK